MAAIWIIMQYCFMTWQASHGHKSNYKSIEGPWLKMNCLHNPWCLYWNTKEPFMPTCNAFGVQKSDASIILIVIFISMKLSGNSAEWEFCRHLWSRILFLGCLHSLPSYLSVYGTVISIHNNPVQCHYFQCSSLWVSFLFLQWPWKSVLDESLYWSALLQYYKWVIIIMLAAIWYILA